MATTLSFRPVAFVPSASPETGNEVIFVVDATVKFYNRGHDSIISIKVHLLASVLLDEMLDNVADKQGCK